MGRYLTARAARRRAGAAPRAQVVEGALDIVIGCALTVAAAWVARRAAARLPGLARPVVEGGLLSTLLAERMLTREVLATDRALDEGLDAARRRLRGLVSREVDALDVHQLRESALESLAENASDSIVAPLWWYGVAGLPGAAAYRFVNTADAMWGYRTPVWEWRGKVAARLDDLCNWAPARLTALLLAPGSDIGRLAREARRTPSPNAGWPMAAVALRWDVRLGKPGVYTLNLAGRQPVRSDIEEAVARVRRAAVVTSVVAALVGRARA